MEGYTNFTKVFAKEVKADSFVGDVTGMVTLTPETVAAAGADHTDATAITKQIALVTAADGAKGVIISGTISPRIIRNTDGTTNALKVYPVLGEPMNGVVDAAVEVAAGKTLVVAKVGTGWYTLFIA